MTERGYGEDRHSSPAHALLVVYAGNVAVIQHCSNCSYCSLQRRARYPSPAPGAPRPAEHHDQQPRSKETNQ